MIKYYPYKYDKPNKNNCLQMIIIVYFDSAGYFDFTFIKMKQEN